MKNKTLDWRHALALISGKATLLSPVYCGVLLTGRVYEKIGVMVFWGTVLRVQLLGTYGLK
jgi:hypothetical protein